MDCHVDTPSLLNITLSKMAVILWNQDDVRESISTYSIEFGEWQKIVEQVKAKLTQISVPDILKSNLVRAIQRIGSEIRHWLTRHGENIDVDDFFIAELTHKLCWNANGTVNRKRTAEFLANDQSLDLGFRYRLSCFYCLEDKVRELWEEMDADERVYENDLCDLNFYERRLTTFWTFFLTDQMRRLEYDIKRYDPDNSPFEYAFQCSAEQVNETAMRYFWQKLTEEQKDKHLQMAQDTGVVCFLISEMTKEQQLRVFQNWPYKVLDGLLFWPRLDLFVRASRCVWGYLSGSEYNKLLLNMISGCAYSFDVFEFFWKEAPETLRKYVLENRNRVPLILETLLKCGDEENFKLILKEYDEEAKDDVLFGSGGIRVCADFISKAEWHCFKVFAGECLTSRNSITQLEDDIDDHLSHGGRYYDATGVQMWNEYKPKFFHELDQYLQNKLTQSQKINKDVN